MATPIPVVDPTTIPHPITRCARDFDHPCPLYPWLIASYTIHLGHRETRMTVGNMTCSKMEHETRHDIIMLAPNPGSKTAHPQDAN